MGAQPAFVAHLRIGPSRSTMCRRRWTVFAQSPAVVGPAGAKPFVFPSGVMKYRVSGGRIGEGEFIEVDAAKAAKKAN